MAAKKSDQHPSDQLRVIHKDVDMEVTIARAWVDAYPESFTVLDKPALGPDGYPLPPKPRNLPKSSGATEPDGAADQAADNPTA